MKSLLRLVALTTLAAVLWLAPTQAAAAASSKTKAPPSDQIVVEGVAYAVRPGQELRVPLKTRAPADADPKTIPAVALFTASTQASGTAANPPRATMPMSANCWSSNGRYAAVLNVYGQTLVSYEMDVSYSADTIANLVTGYNRTYDHWYANGGFGYWWYYNAEQNVNTEINRQSATTARSIHFTGPYGQTQNIEIAIDMHGDCSSRARDYEYPGDNKMQ